METKVKEILDIIETEREILKDMIKIEEEAYRKNEGDESVNHYENANVYYSRLYEVKKIIKLIKVTLEENEKKDFVGSLKVIE